MRAATAFLVVVLCQGCRTPVRTLVASDARTGRPVENASVELVQFRHHLFVPPTRNYSALGRTRADGALPGIELAEGAALVVSKFGEYRPAELRRRGGTYYVVSPVSRPDTLSVGESLFPKDQFNYREARAVRPTADGRIDVRLLPESR